MAMSIKLRKSWELSAIEKGNFDGFEFVSASMIEEELHGPWQHAHVHDHERGGVHSQS